MTMLPPTRDLPPGRQSQIRASLERSVASDASRGFVLRFALPALAGAFVVAAATVSVVKLSPTTPVDVDTAELTSSLPSAPPSFGLSPENVAMIEQGCAKSQQLSDRPTMRQFARDDTGRWALLYTDKVALSCEIGRGGEEYDTNRPEQVPVAWLPGHFSLDVNGSRLGGDVHPSTPALAGIPGLRFVAGRVSSSVARMTYRAPDGKTVDAKIANGTYVARIAYPSTWDPGDLTGAAELRAYDAAGNLLGTSAELAGACYHDPGSKAIVYGERGAADPAKCKPATPWK